MRFQKGDNLGNLNKNWKGENVTREAKHVWIKYYFGRPMFCEECKSETVPEGKVPARWFQWANISGEYKRDRSDWKRLCINCHVKMDSKLRAHGERIHTAKLNWFQVMRLRLMKEVLPSISQRKLGSIYKIDRSTVADILKRKIWKHI